MEVWSAGEDLDPRSTLNGAQGRAEGRTLRVKWSPGGNVLNGSQGLGERSLPVKIHQIHHLQMVSGELWLGLGHGR